MKLSSVIKLLLAIAAVLFVTLLELTYHYTNTKPADGTLLAILVGDVQHGLAWLFGIATALTSGAHFVKYVLDQIQQQQAQGTAPKPPAAPAAPQPDHQPENQS